MKFLKKNIENWWSFFLVSHFEFKKKIMKTTLASIMRYHFFMHYGWFLQNLGEDFNRTNMHAIVVNVNIP